MRLPNILLSVAVIIAASLANAQQLKVIKDTVDYKLMEVDSGYFYSHGIEKKNDFILDTSIIKKKNGILRLPLLNGKFKEFKDSLMLDTFNWDKKEYVYSGENKRLKCYLVIGNYWESSGYFLIDKNNGEKDFLNNMPNYSPSYIYYGYCFFYHMDDPMKGVVIVENLKTKKIIRLFLDKQDPTHFKWIDDYKFLFKTDVIGGEEYKETKDKYFLVEIKK